MLSKCLILSCKALSFIKPEFVNFLFYWLKKDVDDIDEAKLKDFHNCFEKRYILNYDANIWNYRMPLCHSTYFVIRPPPIFWRSFIKLGILGILGIPGIPGIRGNSLNIKNSMKIT